jgi:acetyl-CoA carboxylase carboxyltransferase component
MQTLPTTVDRTSDEFASNRKVMLDKLVEFEELQAQARLGGGQKYIDRHRSRG